MSETEQQTSPLQLDEFEQSLQNTWQWIVLIGLIALGIIAGVLLSQVFVPKPKVGIVRLYDVIGYDTGPYYLVPLHDAAEESDIAAVVIFVDSPGGDATVSEELFYTIQDLRDKKPVVASIERFGASGSYYAAAAANYIFARPAAQVGSIGVVAGLPTEYRPDEELLTTGPFKGSGNSQIDYTRGVEVIKEAFLTHVYDQRAYALEHMHPESRLDVLPERDLIATGQLWTGSEAYDIGLIDELGSNQDAIRKAAEMAGISNYEVVDLLARFLEMDDEEYTGFSAEEAVPDWYETGPWVKLYHLYTIPEE